MNDDRKWMTHRLAGVWGTPDGAITALVIEPKDQKGRPIWVEINDEIGRRIIDGPGRPPRKATIGA